MVMIAAAVLLAGTASSASAAGDPAVDKLIVTNALPGWTRLPDSMLDPTVANERRAVGTVTNLTFQVAVEGWRQGTQSIIVVLISFPNGKAPSDFRARDAVIGACGAASKNAPRNMHSYPVITGSTEAECSGQTTNGVHIDAAVMSWQKDNIFALVIGNRFTTAALERFSVAQDAALSGTTSGSVPAPVGDSGSSSRSSRIGFIVGVGVLIVVVGAIVFLLIARSKSRMPAPVQALGGRAGAAPYSPFAAPAASPFPTPGAAPPGSPYATSAPAPSPFAAPVAPTPPAAAPGWQPIDGDPTRIAYWDGTTFTAWKRWDGSAWID